MDMEKTDQANAGDDAVLDSVADRLSSLLDDVAQQTEPNDTQSDNSDAEIAADQAAGAGEPADDGGDAADKTEAQGEPNEGEDEAPQKFRVKVDGQEIEVELPELLAGYSRQADYTRGKTELAEQRKALDTEREQVRQHFTAQVEKLAQLAQLVAAADPVLAEAAQTDWAKLAEENHEEFIRRRARVDSRLMTLNAVDAEYRKLLAQQHREQLMREAVALKQAIPELADPEKAKTLRAGLEEYLGGMGFSPQEIASISDHRLLRLAYEGMQHKKMLSERAEAAKKKVETAKPKSVKPNSAERAARRPTVDRAKLNRLSLYDQATVLANLL